MRKCRIESLSFRFWKTTIMREFRVLPSFFFISIRKYFQYFEAIFAILKPFSRPFHTKVHTPHSKRTLFPSMLKHPFLCVCASIFVISDIPSVFFSNFPCELVHTNRLTPLLYDDAAAWSWNSGGFFYTVCIIIHDQEGIFSRI